MVARIGRCLLDESAKSSMQLLLHLDSAMTPPSMSDTSAAKRFIEDLELVAHPEVGWFKVVYASEDKVSSPYAGQGEL